MSLVSGYDSDESDNGNQKAASAVGPAADTSRSTLSSILPPPSNGSQKHSSLNLPSPSSSIIASATATGAARRRNEKRQIRIEKLSDEEEEDRGVGGSEKRLKVSAGAARAGPSQHGLLGMLPAPSNKGPLPKEASDGSVSSAAKDASRAINYGLDEDAEGKSKGALKIEETESTKKSKGNSDFRAMLGLKASAQPARKGSNGESAKMQQKDLKQRDHKLSTSVADGRPVDNGRPVQPSVAVDFFASEEASTSRSQISAAAPSSRPAILLAPQVQDEDNSTSENESEHLTDPYQGWQQGPDGAWFPVTPEAHAHYEAYLATQAQAKAQLEAEARLRGIHPSQIKDMDANANLDDWIASRAKTGHGAEAQSLSLDKKYAAAAASMITPEQARALGLDRQDDEDEQEARENERKKHDKSTNYRAQRRGQLSSLVAQAAENKEKLEEKWARERANRDEARNRYGW